MATSVSLFLDTIGFSAATAVFTDIELTTKAPDGFYTYGTLNREQLSGFLQSGVDCSTFSSCTSPSCTITSPIQLGYDSGSGDAACANFSPSSPTYYTFDGLNFGSTNGLNQTPICTQPASSGYYSDGIISRYFDTTTGNFNTPVACANSVEFFGDELPAYGGVTSGGFTELNGTVQIIGSPVTFRAYVYIPDEDGYASTSLNIGGNGGESRYVELVSPNYGNAYSISFTLPAGVYTWQVIFSWNGLAGSLGEGGIDWTQ